MLLLCVGDTDVRHESFKAEFSLDSKVILQIWLLNRELLVTSLGAYFRFKIKIFNTPLAVIIYRLYLIRDRLLGFKTDHPCLQGPCSFHQNRLNYANYDVYYFQNCELIEMISWSPGQAIHLNQLCWTRTEKYWIRETWFKKKISWFWSVLFCWQTIMYLSCPQMFTIPLQFKAPLLGEGSLLATNELYISHLVFTTFLLYPVLTHCYVAAIIY